MDIENFGRYVWLIEDCFYHNLDLQWVILDHAEQVLRYFDCDEEWLWPIIVMAQGWSYYGADAWMKEFAQ